MINSDSMFEIIKLPYNSQLRVENRFSPSFSPQVFIDIGIEIEATTLVRWCGRRISVW